MEHILLTLCVYVCMDVYVCTDVHMCKTLRVYYSITYHPIIYCTYFQVIYFVCISMCVGIYRTCMRNSDLLGRVGFCLSCEPQGLNSQIIQLGGKYLYC